MSVEKYYFWGEREWRRQKHVDPALVEIIREKRPDLVMIGSVTAAFHVQSVFSLGPPCCVMTLDKVVSLYRRT